jgi:hypothetical protein
MSAFAALPARADQEPMEGHDRQERRAQGQRHDRIDGGVGNGAGSGGERDEAVEITVSQRMLSATTGSLLTSLLGNAPSQPRPRGRVLTDIAQSLRWMSSESGFNHNQHLRLFLLNPTILLPLLYRPLFRSSLQTSGSQRAVEKSSG